MEAKLEEIKIELNNLYKKASSKAEVVINVNKNSDELTDHDYIDNIESIETVTVLKVENVKETKKKAKKVSITDEIKVEVCFRLSKITVYCLLLFLMNLIFLF